MEGPPRTDDDLADSPDPLDRWAAEYWGESRRPLTSLAFIAPLLAVYEVGVLSMGPQAVRNGADVWLRRFLEWLDLGHYFLLPALTVCLLLAWHYLAHHPWRVSRSVLSTMVVECVLLAIALRLLLYVEAAVLRAVGAVLTAIGGDSGTPLDLAGALGSLVGFLGAGVYEELLFRLIFLSSAAWALRRCGLDRARAALAAVLATSLTFAAAHYVGVYGDPVELGRFAFWFGFVFRFMAGVFFSALFVWRGFGIAVGTHAAYDILIKLW
jgi:hypothetical protein